VMKRIFGIKGRGTGERWRNLHYEDLHNLCSSSHIIMLTISRAVRWTGHVARMKEVRNALMILVKNPERKIQLRRTKCR